MKTQDLITEMGNSIRYSEIDQGNPKNKEIILGIIKHFAEDTPQEQILESIDSEDFCKTLITKIRKTEIAEVTVDNNFWERDSNLEWDKYTIRHYTTENPSKFGGLIKSNLRLSVEQEIYDAPNTELNKSGHTTLKDWSSIGNVGDTFYSLFFEGKSATGKTPAFIEKATYYIEWPIDKFISCWASSDWLSLIQNNDEPSYSGPSKNVILGSLLRKNKIQGVDITPAEYRFYNPTNFLKDYSNFEIKKHGSMDFDTYYAKDDSGNWIQFK